MSDRTLEQWLQYQEQLHPDQIELGLDRVQEVWRRIQLAHGSISCPAIVVGGTNGKGSTIAFLEQIYLAGGYSTLAYTSPHILLYNERVRLNGNCADDALLVEAFEQVECARQSVRLTYFEFGTLAALFIALKQSPQVMLLEVGLGGRLDAVNILQHDVAVITSISMDHVEWLGDNLSAIAVEKAGIARSNKPLIIGCSNVPRSLHEQAAEAGAIILTEERDFKIERYENGWNYHSLQKEYRRLPLPKMAGSHQLNNAASAITAVNCLSESLPINEEEIRTGLKRANLPGRFEQVSTSPAVYLDVAHNEAAAHELHAILQAFKDTGEFKAVFAMQSNREPDLIMGPLQADISRWYLAPLANGLGHKADYLASTLVSRVPQTPIDMQPNVALALSEAIRQSQKEDIIVVFGSFYTVAEAKAAMHV